MTHLGRFLILSIWEKTTFFYHLGCGDTKGIEIAINEYGIKKAIGIDISQEKISRCKIKSIKNSEFICGDAVHQEYKDATVILFWFADQRIIDSMTEKFQRLSPNCKIITILDPLPNFKPDNVRFPYLVYITPFTKSETIQDQLLSIFGVNCIDFVTAWEFAERYTKAIGSPKAQNDRFLTIMQSVIMWINAQKSRRCLR